MYYKLFGIIIIILTIIFAIIYLSTNDYIEFFSSNSKTKLGVETEHLEYAYKLCTQDQSPECRNFVILYDKLRKSFKKLKKNFCDYNPDKCKELLKN